MTDRIPGYHGVVLDIDLTTGKSRETAISPNDYELFLGGRGLGMKILWDRLKKPGIDPLSPENPLIFMPGPFNGFPLPSSSRTCVITKSPHTSPIQSKYSHASTISYANMGGFFGPEIRFAGYDGIVITGKAPEPVYIRIENDKVEVREANQFWGMNTDAFDNAFINELGDRRFRTCYIGTAGENQVEYACILNTAARAAGRGGTGCVMGSKNLKAVAVRGTGQPDVADHKRFTELLGAARNSFEGTASTAKWRYAGTAALLAWSSSRGTMAVRNYREGTFTEIDRIDANAAIQKAWIRNFSCFCCPLSCKKSGVVTQSRYDSLVHDGPEYETGTMLGANLMISDLGGVLKAIYHADDYGVDIISAGNVIGFLMEAYEKQLIDRKFLDGIDLNWGNVDGTIQILARIAKKQGVGELAARGVKALSDAIGKDAQQFAIHVKGHELAAWNVHADPARGIGYATANRGACHLNGNTPQEQNTRAVSDCTGVCAFAESGRYGWEFIPQLVGAITGIDRSAEAYVQIGERTYNLEKLFNYREGFVRADDAIPARFFTEPLSIGPRKGAVLAREKFDTMLDDYYQNRGWDLKTSKPLAAKLKSLKLTA